MSEPTDDDLLDEAALADLVELIGDDAAGRQSVIRLARALFREADIPAAIGAALGTRDAASVATLAHRLKGRAASLGCAVLSQLAAVVERHARTATDLWPAEIGAVLPELAVTWERSGRILADRLGLDRAGDDTV
jgi:HPt (histidine-containing phosphotransfer) domain-containing protein